MKLPAGPGNGLRDMNGRPRGEASEKKRDDAREGKLVLVPGL